MSTTNTFSNPRRQSARRWIQWAAQLLVISPEFQIGCSIKCFTLMIWYHIRVKQLWKITIAPLVGSKRCQLHILKWSHQRTRQQFWRGTTHLQMIWATTRSKKVVGSWTPHLVKIVRFWTVRIRKASRSWTSCTPFTIRIPWTIWHILHKSSSYPREVVLPLNRPQATIDFYQLWVLPITMGLKRVRNFWSPETISSSSMSPVWW